MILKLQLPKNKKGEITQKPSSYQASKEVKDVTCLAMKDFGIGHQIMTKPHREFNDMTVVERQAKDQKSFNSYQEPKSTDPDEAWRSNAIRPIVRNRTISIAAHTTASLIFPNIFAQNENDDDDKDAATVMRDLMEWSADQSNYEKTLLYGVIAALVNPACIIHTEYAEVWRVVKEILETGKWKDKKILDEAFSGFKDTLVPIDELFIGDIYESDIQKQPFLIWRRAIDFSIAEQKYGENPKFRDYVRPGLQMVFDQASETFYEQFDEDLRERLVEEVIYYNRSKDLQLVFLNGVLVTEWDQPNPRKDKQYPFVKFGYETMDEGKFFYYKSLVFKGAPDEESINLLYRTIIDGALMQLMPPTALYGDEQVNSSVMIPGSVNVFKETTKLEAINLQNNFNAAMNTLEKLEASYSESSNDTLQSGQAGKGNQTAFEIGRLEENARIQLGLFGKMIGFGVEQYAYLRMSDILQYLTVGQVMELEGEAGRMKFNSFLLPEKVVDGKTKSRKIVFDNKMPNEPISEQEDEQMGFDLLEQEGGMDSKKQIMRVSPGIFRDLKYKVKVTPDIVTPPSDNIKKALNLEAYDRAINNPYANQEAVYRDLLLGSYAVTKNDPDKYINKNPQQPNGQNPAQGGLVDALGANNPELMKNTI